MSGWIWLNRAVVLAVQDIQLAEHGGGAGVRDAGLLDSALARPLNLVADGERRRSCIGGRLRVRHFT